MDKNGTNENWGFRPSPDLIPEMEKAMKLLKWGRRQLIEECIRKGLPAVLSEQKRALAKAS